MENITIDELFVGRTLGRLTPLRVESSLVVTEQVRAIEVSFVGRDKYHVLPNEGVQITDVFINTAHRAVPVRYTQFREAEDPLHWSFVVGGPHWKMVEIIYLPANALRPLDPFHIKRVGR